MKLWRKKAGTGLLYGRVARAAVAGAARDELLREAVNALAKEGAAERVGVWLQAQNHGTTENPTSTGFRGIVWDQENETVPAEWNQLAPEAPLPQALWNGGKSVEQELRTSEKPIIGPLMELRRALWVPIERKGRVRGVLLAGTRKKQVTLPREQAEMIAAELALAVELEEEQKVARERHVDVTIVRRTLASLSTAATSPDTILSSLVQNCMELESANGPGATFAIIGAFRIAELGSLSGTAAEMEFRWTSGEERWVRTVENEPLVSLWRKAIDSHRVVGSEPPNSWARPEIARIVAIPLEAEEASLGVLVAGLSRTSASLTNLDRLELRASLAARALAHRLHDAEEKRQIAWQRGLLNATNEATILLNRRGEILAISRSAHELLGGSANETSPENAQGRELFLELFRARDKERIESWLRRHITKTSQDSIEADLRNGIPVRLRMETAESAAPCIVVLERLRVPTAGTPAERAEAELQNVLEWLEEGVVLFDMQQNVRAINMRFEQIAGFTPDESGTYKSLESLIEKLEVQAAEPANFAERWRELARGIDGGVHEELQMVRPVPRILERSARPVLDATGRQLGRVEIYRDLTAQRVFQSKLLQTEKLAELGRLVTGVAHELSNPLTSILGYAQRLLLRNEAASRMEEVRQIFQEAERATGILRQLLNNARESQPERRNISLNQVVQRALDLQRFSLAAEKINVEFDLDPVLPLIRGDAGQLQQILMNLVANAQQALEEQGRGGKIRLRTRRIEEDRVRLEVEDDGPGIPRAIQARIFDPFFTTKPAGIGTGLGLSIVLSIVREHGGQVHVISPPEGGTLFSVDLPTAQSQENIAKTQTSATEEYSNKIVRPRSVKVRKPQTVKQTHTVANKDNRVLIVEDEPTVARLIADVLEDEGFQAVILLDGREALERAATETFDLVICDMKMPGLDGQHFYSTLEQTQNPLHRRFLFVTGDVMAASTNEFLHRHQLAHLAKPFRVEELAEKVRLVLGKEVQEETGAAVAARKK